MVDKELERLKTNDLEGGILGLLQKFVEVDNKYFEDNFGFSVVLVLNKEKTSEIIFLRIGGKD